MSASIGQQKRSRELSSEETASLEKRQCCRQQDPLHINGYRVYRAAFTVSDTVVEAAKRFSATGAQEIFNFNEDSARSDRRRRQKCLSTGAPGALRTFAEDLQAFVKKQVSDHLDPKKFVVLRSRPGCQDQAAHCDYVPDAALRGASDKEMPLGMITCLMSGTKLNIWPGSHRLATASAARLEEVSPIKCQVVELDAGDVLVFRGDFVHAGSAYDKDNYRIHCFLDSDTVPRDPNRTFIIHRSASSALKELIVPKGR